MKGSRIIIPESLQVKATRLAHIGHQGIEKTERKRNNRRM